MEATWKLRRINILSSIKTCGILSFALGLITGTIWGSILAFFSTLVSMMFGGTNPGFGVAAVIIMPFFCAAVFCVLGIFLSFFLTLLYNITAGTLGGIEFEMDFERRDEKNEIYSVV
jgi:hypothetical protein